MLISKQNRKAIYQHLFKEGVLVAKKDYEAPSHPELTTVRNLEVIKAMQSLESRGYVKTQFAWQYYYYFLTDAGIQFLREVLNLPADIVPATYKKTARTATARPGMPTRESRNAESEEYRRRGDKKEVAPGGFNPEFRGGMGRGRQ
jgi:small subunit ribosomal protein S10e